MKKTTPLIILISMVLVSCNTLVDSNKIFGDSSFKNSIALIELYESRFGEYPDSLSHILYRGDNSKISFANVEYKKTNNGYKLNLIKGFDEFPENLCYPSVFWTGLGCEESNLKCKNDSMFDPYDKIVARKYSDIETQKIESSDSEDSFNHPKMMKITNEIAIAQIVYTYNDIVSLIELHKKRYNKFPSSYNDLTFLGNWDFFQGYQYKNYGDFYKLNVYLDSLNLIYNSKVKPIDLKLPPDFYNGIGLSESLIITSTNKK